MGLYQEKNVPSINETQDEEFKLTMSEEDKKDAAPIAAMYWFRPHVSGLEPPKLRAHASAVYQGKMYVYGGTTKTACSNTLYILDLDTFCWSIPKVYGSVLPPCRAHSFVVDEQRGDIYLMFGGDEQTYYNHIYKLNTHSMTWTHLRTYNTPSERRAQTATFWNNTLYLFGGGDGTRALNDVYQLNLETLEWKEVMTTGKSPNDRGYHTGTLVQDKWVILGGSDGKECFGDIFVLDLSLKKWYTVNNTLNRLAHTSTCIGSFLFVMGGHDGNQYCQDLHLLDLVHMTWETKKVCGTKPSPRGYHTTVYYDGRLILFGGYDGADLLNDVHGNEENSTLNFLQRITSNNDTSIPIPTNSWGMLVLSNIQNQQEDLEDVIQFLLTHDKAIVLLPVSIPSHPSAIIDQEFIMDHIMITIEENHVVSPSGIHGIIEGSLFNMDTSSTTINYPKYNILASHIQLPLKGDKQMNATIIQKPISRKEITDWISNKLKDSLNDKADEFIKHFKKNIPRTMDTMSQLFLEFMHKLQQDYSDDKDRLDKIESYVCQELYDYFFTDPQGDEAIQGEALESRIAAFNLLDLNISHLGVTIDQKDMETIVSLASHELQVLDKEKGPKEKLYTLVKIHQIITDTIGEQSTDVLLPILIYTIVKTNPTRLLSNLKYISRFQRPDQLAGQSSYCLTNTMAAVSFLETANLVGLGLSADKVISHVEDLKESSITKPNNHNNNGLKLMNDVVDSSYRAVFDGINKLWQRNSSSNKAQENGPITKFLEMKSVDELKIGEVTELLADYKRLAAIIKQAGLA
ncbi:hypothetical protein G6F46_009830 [Rhizopus delemar]|nr:hypothetical protein G6F55_009362 [Rhizopus delemar]KAG1537536.1 hypothetical protein G6F51_010310 [Rhizopus arrhizus]KAG1492386.1 hypothetical protein G6F54_009351 [Rhizopus delemar]KAG1507504.1 hypothetical protein G6F53_008903 [Rhizopus delemar]KAG1520548.1 hypothetical protein G6F52_007558 [Rhizopus delemar]